MKIHLIRHGSTLWNEKGLWQGRKDVPLSVRGKIEARLLALRFASAPLDRVYSSPLSRARDTAEEIAKVHGVKVETIEDLIEADFSRWEGKDGREIKERLDVETYELWSSDPHAEIDGIEPVFKVHERAVRALKRILEGGGEEVAVVTHAMLMRVMICYVLGLDLKNFRNFHLYNASVTTFVTDHIGLRLARLNDTSHLKGVFV